MSETVTVHFERDREWIYKFTKVPLTALNHRQCSFKEISLITGSFDAVPGDLFVECYRNDKGVVVTVALPTGCLVPTGRVAPKSSWFPMLKNHLRDMLAVTPEGRLFRVANYGIQQLEKQIEASSEPLERDRARQALTALKKVRNSVLGNVPTGASDESILASFYNWIADTANHVNISQNDVMAVIKKAVTEEKTVEVPDLDPELFRQEARRFLDL